MTEPTNPFAHLTPGFDFLQNLIQSSHAAMPHMGQWVTPTLNPEELKKRIDELKVVQFWLDQNARMLNTTLQALEVQRMTLATLSQMNVPMADLQSALHAAPGEQDGAPSAINPLQWWSSLTEQFSQLAAKAMKNPEPTASQPEAPPSSSAASKPKTTRTKKA